MQNTRNDGLKNQVEHVMANDQTSKYDYIITVK